jgi:hypothetical protein
MELFSSVVNWCVEKWHALIPSIAQEKAVLDIVGELQKMNNLKDDEKGLASLLPIHELLPHKGVDSISTLLIFKAGGSAILPCSKIQFYADPDGTKLVKEVLAGNDMRADLGALVLSEGKIWVNLQAGTKALLSLGEQDDIEARLECAVFQIPKEWIVVCWLTEVLTSTLISQGGARSATYELEVFEKLIAALVAFYDESKAPSILKSVILKLLSRIIIKLRHIYHTLEEKNLFTSDLKQKSHL